MFTTSTKRKAIGTAFVVGIALALTTAASAAMKHHHHARRHISSQGKGSYASAPAADPFAHDPTMYLIKNHIPVPDKTSPGFYPK